MKELNKKKETPQEVVYQQTKQQEIEYQYQGSIMPHRNHKVWEINIRTNKIKEAEYIQDKEIIFGTNLEHLPPRKLLMNADCVYIAALNAKNALKRYKIGKGSAGIKESDIKLGY